MSKLLLQVFSKCAFFWTGVLPHSNPALSHQMRHLIYCIIILLAYITYATSHPIFAPFEESLKSQDLQRKSLNVNVVNSRQKLFPNNLQKLSFVRKQWSERERHPRRRAARQSGFMNRHRRLQRLATKSGFYVEIRKKGKVKGSRRASPYTLLEFISIRPGVVAIRGRRSGRYLAMDKKGRLAGMRSYNSACNFYEVILANKFIVFYHQKKKKRKKGKEYITKIYMAFDKRGKPKRGKKVHVNSSVAHFQKLIARFPLRRIRGKKSRGRKKSRLSRGRKRKKT